MTLVIPERVNFIIKKLENAGFEAYCVGGGVRDMVMGKIPEDWDISRYLPIFHKIIER